MPPATSSNATVSKYPTDPFQNLPRKKKHLLTLAVVVGIITGGVTAILLLNSDDIPLRPETGVLDSTTTYVSYRSQTTPTPPGALEWNTYTTTSTAENFSFKYPSHMRIHRNNSGAIELQNAPSKLEDNIAAQINVSSESALFSALFQTNEQEELMHPDTSEIITKLTDRKIGEYDAIEYVIEPSDTQAEEQYGLGVIIKKDDYFFDITARRSSTNNLLDFLQTFEKIVDSIEFFDIPSEKEELNDH